MSNIFSRKTIFSITSRLESMVYQQTQELISLQMEQNYQLVEIAKKENNKGDIAMIFQCELEYQIINNKNYPDKEILEVFDYYLVNDIKITIKEAFIEKNKKQNQISCKDPKIINKILYHKYTVQNHENYIKIFASNDNKLRNITEYYMDPHQKIWSYDERPDIIQETMKPLLLRNILIGTTIDEWIITEYLTENKLKKQIFLKGELIKFIEK
jgi:hypothetical protein